MDAGSPNAFILKANDNWSLAFQNGELASLALPFSIAQDGHFIILQTELE